MEMKIKDMEGVIDSLIKVNEYDILLYSDRLKFSEWFLAISVAGFATVTTKYDYLNKASWLMPNSEAIVSIILLAIFFILVSVVFGVLYKNSLNAIAIVARKRMTLLLLQKAYLSIQHPSGVVECDSVDDMIENIKSWKYLESSKIGDVSLSEPCIKLLDSRSVRYALIQKSTVGIGYLLILILFVPGSKIIPS